MSQIIPVTPQDDNFQIFHFGEFDIRVLPDDNNDPRFLASDVCAALQIANTRDALSRLDDDEKGVVLIYTPGGRQNALYVTEAGLYALINSARKKTAEITAFKRWVNHEMIPAVRKTGSYIQKSLTPAELALVYAQQLVDHERQLAQLQSGQQELDSRVSHIETNLNTDEMFFTLKAWYIHVKQPCPPRQELAMLGKRASTLSREQGYDTGSVPDATYEHVKTYHQNILRQVVK